MKKIMKYSVLLEL